MLFSLLALVVGVAIGWTVPTPAWFTTVVNKVSSLFGKKQ